MPEDTQTRILLARHPETVANRERRYIGHSDSPYTPRGARQAASLARCIAGWRADAVLASPARRTAEPAAVAAAALGLPLATDALLAEVGWGEAEGLTYGEIRRAGIPMDYLGGPAAGEIVRGGETWPAFEARMRAAASLVEHAGGRVAVVTHGGVIRALLVRWLGLPSEAAWRFAIRPASVSLLIVGGGAATLEAFGLQASACARRSGR